MFHFLEEFLIGMAAVRIRKAVALVVKSSGGFNRLRCRLPTRMDSEAQQDGGCNDEGQGREFHHTLRSRPEGCIEMIRRTPGLSNYSSRFWKSWYQGNPVFPDLLMCLHLLTLTENWGLASVTALKFYLANLDDRLRVRIVGNVPNDRLCVRAKASLKIRD